MKETYKKLYQILTSRERRLVLVLFALMFSSAVMETVGIASILPFIAVLANPDIVQKNQYLLAIFNYLGFQETRPFLIFLGFGFLTLFLFGLLMRALAFWAQARFSNRRQYAISSRLFFGYLSKEYEWFLDKHSARLAAAVLTEVGQTIERALFPALQIIAHAMVILLLAGLLLSVDPFLAIAVLLVLGGSYLVIYVSLHRWIERLGELIFRSNRGRFRTTQEALGGIKDLKMKGLELSFLKRFQLDAARFTKSLTAEQLIGQLPSFVMQGIIFGGMLLAILYLLTRYERFDQALPILAMYAVAGYRLMPSLQSLYRNFVRLRNAKPVLDSLHADLQQIAQVEPAHSSLGNPDPMSFRSEIRLQNVRYRYPSAGHDALEGLNISIPRFATVAFVGPTGCGKTTTVDIILGLLKPRAGTVTVDGAPLGPDNVRAWQRNIGYVPQDIYLSDASIAENIAYGLPHHALDRNSVVRAARTANIHEFITNELARGYDTEVGERGVRLSGGQKQRIGIARALYHDPEVLVLDEATSALDNLTERALMQAVRGLARKKTIIMIAHRLSTVKECDIIFLLDNGRITASGAYQELLDQSDYFRRLSGDQEPAND